MGPSPVDTGRNDLGKVLVRTSEELAATPWEPLHGIDGGQEGLRGELLGHRHSAAAGQQVAVHDREVLVVAGQEGRSGVVATADSGILDSCRHWFNFTTEVLDGNEVGYAAIDLSLN